MFYFITFSSKTTTKVHHRQQGLQGVQKKISYWYGSIKTQIEQKVKFDAKIECHYFVTSPL